ncbi:LacI family DNA-binding transcriptional regulator [Halanaerobium sp. ST460_2HS_T2]|jgi:LacI family transcriptional regulator|uniref:LacI family DNA-binding transcriptional regulator n=1 Tax=Halanaerobium sp. ST460_2HS_T2 TaxID=2183914 RepID=UPI000DF1E3F9|nr:LacI family DNA-binding transcriptional regulator [Halanaerobium sp. ST460_2HS_T2]RCW61078.1 LacI family transcriptional regulator [Halanaerobium sp. ST460_2HS_T2]
MIRLKDVAKKANVSPATASLALNDNELVNDKTKARVKKVAKEMNYIPDARAKALKTKETKIIGLVIPEIDNPFFSEIAKEIKTVAKKNGYNIIYCGVESKEDELDYITLFRGMQVDGAIFASSVSTSDLNIDLIKELADNFIPVVFIDRLLDAGDRIDSVNSDLERAAFIAAEHLYNLGHRKIAFAGKENEFRMTGYLKVLKKYNLNYDNQYLFKNILSFEDGYKLGKKIADQLETKRPTAILSHNDEVAIGLVQSLVSSGISVPDKISICGIDNIRLSHFYNPALTTVDIPNKKMARKAIKLLLNKIKNKNKSAARHIKFDVSLIERETTQKVGLNI